GDVVKACRGRPVTRGIVDIRSRRHIAKSRHAKKRTSTLSQVNGGCVELDAASGAGGSKLAANLAVRKIAAVHVDVEEAGFQISHVRRRQRNKDVAEITLRQGKQNWRNHTRATGSVNVRVGFSTRQSAEVERHTRRRF